MSKFNHLVQSPGEHNCIIYSVAMLFNSSVKELEDMLGNKGNQKAWPKLPEPYCFRSYHIQEIIEIGIRMGFMMTPIYKEFHLTPNYPEGNSRIDLSRTNSEMINIIKNFKCLLVTEKHALAYFPKISLPVFDPNGQRYELESVINNIETAFLIKSI